MKTLKNIKTAFKVFIVLQIGHGSVVIFNKVPIEGDSIVVGNMRAEFKKEIPFNFEPDGIKKFYVPEY